MYFLELRALIIPNVSNNYTRIHKSSSPHSLTLVLSLLSPLRNVTVIKRNVHFPSQAQQSTVQNKNIRQRRSPLQVAAATVRLMKRIEQWRAQTF